MMVMDKELKATLDTIFNYGYHAGIAVGRGDKDASEYSQIMVEKSEELEKEIIGYIKRSLEK